MEGFVPGDYNWRRPSPFAQQESSSAIPRSQFGGIVTSASSPLHWCASGLGGDEGDGCMLPAWEGQGGAIVR